LEFRNKNGRALNHRAACSVVAVPVAPVSADAIATTARAVAAMGHRQAVKAAGDSAAQAMGRPTVRPQEARLVDRPAIVPGNHRHPTLQTILRPVRRRDNV
jgi:hypothetical protein